MTEKEEKAIYSFNKWIEISEKENLDNYQIVDEDIEDMKTILNLIQKQQKSLEQKDKIIDEMALSIANLDIDEEICKHQVAIFCDESSVGVTIDVCAKCIKQYFERKMGENNEPIQRI